MRQLAAASLDAVATELVRGVIEERLTGLPPHGLQLGISIRRISIYAAWSVLFLALRQFVHLREGELRRSKVEYEARNAELRALRAQLNPHFLFNSLNSILAEADDNPAAVCKITHGLSELLSFSLRQGGHYGRLGDELAAIENYLEVERSRFEARLDWRIEITAESRAAWVPTSLLLPLVENAIKYGLQTSGDRLRIEIDVQMRDGEVSAVVANTGQWLEPDVSGTRSTGIGLSNLRRRLTLLCGSAAVVKISHAEGWGRVALRVPVAVTPT